jgi:trehalose-phosphatase
LKPNSLSDLVQWLLEKRHGWLFLDYDGTLADFVPSPDQVKPDPKIIHLLKKLVQSDAIRITILSGRKLQHLQLLAPLSGIFLAGTYGIEFLTPQGEMIRRMEYGAIRPYLDRIKPAWERVIRNRNGFFLEDKDWALALHARFAQEQEANWVIAETGQVARKELPEGLFQIINGDRFLEIAPRLANKSKTIDYLLEQYPLPNSHLLYIGDDEMDEEAFVVIHAHGGVAIRVKHSWLELPSTRADFCFESPTDTLHWLKQLLGNDA